MRTMLFCLLVLVLAAATPGVGTCGPLLNEIMGDPNRDWDGDGAYSFRDDEWIEIVNPDPAPLDLSGYYLADETGAFVYGFEGTLEPGAVRVVYGSQAVAWESANGETATGLRLGNDGDTAGLWQVSGSDTLMVDAYTYTNVEAEDDRSSGRMPDGGAEWQLFDALNPYGGSTPPLGNGLPPTPGAANGGDGSTPVRESTWGRVKALFSET